MLFARLDMAEKGKRKQQQERGADEAGRRVIVREHLPERVDGGE